jgi:hypothetical protein
MRRRTGSRTPGGYGNVYGPRSVAALVPGLVKPAFRRRAPATAQVLADWDAIVGPAIAAVTTPRKLFSGTLAIGCSGPVAMELTHLSQQLIERINAHMGKVTVTRLRFLQDMVAPVRPVAPKPRPVDMQAARQAVSSVPPGELHDALEALGRAVLTRHNQ